MTSLLFAEQFYYPEGWGGAQLPRDLTMHLARRGAKVRVVCGSEQYAPIDGESSEDPTRAGVVIRRTPRVLRGLIHERKLLRQIVFCVTGWPLLVLGQAPDLFITQTNPPLFVPLVAAAALLRRRPFMIIAQDIYPEVLFAHGMARPDVFPGRWLTRLFAWAYRRATKVVALGPVMAQRLMHKGVRAERIEIISNWATGEAAVVRGESNQLRLAWGLRGQFVILYSGNIGIAHDIETPIAALRLLLQERPETRLVFVGQGSRSMEAERLAAEAGVSHAVQFRPLVPAAMLPHSLGLADLALVTLREGFDGLVVPSKLIGYMARGLPTVYVGPPSDVDQLLIESGGGTSVRNGDAPALARVIRSWIQQPERLARLGEQAAHYYERHLSRARGLEKYEQLIEAVLKGAAARARRHEADTADRS